MARNHSTGEKHRGKQRPQAEKDPLLVPITDRFTCYSITPKRHEIEERRHKRLRATFKACIRLDDQEELVDVHDFSRGGLRFSSFKLYPLGAPVQVSAPHTVGGNNIFTTAKIVRANRRPNGAVPGEYGFKLQS